MQHLDLQVIRRALEWSVAGQRIWLCTVLATYGSAPRAPGSLLAVNAAGQWIGSLSGGCVEEDFLERVAEGAFLDAVNVVRYGAGDDPRSRVSLPCGGILDVLVEKLEPDCEVQAHLREMESALLGQRRLIREVGLASEARSLFADREQGARIEHRRTRLLRRQYPGVALLRQIGRHIAVDSRGHTLDNAGGVLVADGTLDVHSGALNNAGGLL